MYLILLGIIISFRLEVLHLFSFEWTDGDQVLMWYGAKDFAAGQFHETRFYGQCYNSMLESLIAAPFYSLGYSIHQVLPVVTSFLSLFPFLLISIHLFLKKSSKLALLVISLPLIFPTNYWLITSLPRGIVTGVFMSSLMYIFIHNKADKKSSFFISFLFILSYSINPNAVLLGLPCLVFYMLQHYSKKEFFVPFFMGLLLGFGIHYLLNLFYKLHPHYNLHQFTITYTFKNLMNGLQHLNAYLGDISIIFSHFGISILLVFGLLSYYFWIQKERTKAISIGLVVILVIGTLSMSKIHDALDSIFYSYSRMYLALPVTLALGISFLELKKNVWLVYLYLLIPISCAAFNYQHLAHKISVETDTGKSHMVSIKKVAEVQSECEKLKQIAIKNHIDLMIIGFDWRNTLCGYGCAACVDSFPKTLFPTYERRTWRMIEDDATAYKNIMIIDIAIRVDTLLDDVENLEGKNNMYIIKNNHLKTFAILDSIGMGYRAFK